MPANLLLLPLLAGYIFAHICHRFRYRAQSLDGYRLLIESALAGVVLFGLARIGTLSLCVIAPGACRFWHAHIVPDPNLPYLGTAIVSIGLGVALPIIDNRRLRWGIYSKVIRRVLLARRLRPLRRVIRSVRSAHKENRRTALDSEIRLHGNGLTRLLHDAGTFGTLISVTMVSRKWYVGYVAEAVNLEPKESCFRLLPVLSGYREKDTLKLNREVYYRPVYEKVMTEKTGIGRFVVTLSLKDVQDAREFDEEIYEDHFSKPDDRM